MAIGGLGAAFGRLGALLGGAGGSGVQYTAVANRGDTPSNITAAISTANQLRRIGRSRHYFGNAPIKRIKLVVCNFYCLATQGDLGIGNSVDWQASIEIPNATTGVARITWNAANTVTVPDATANVESDWLYPASFGITSFPANAQFWGRYSIAIASGGKFPTWSPPDSAIVGENAVQCNVTDSPQLDVTGALSTTTPYVAIATSGILPVAIIGETLSGVRLLAIAGAGDSIEFGTGDSGGTGDGFSGRGGYFQRALTNLNGITTPYIRMACPGEDALTWNTKAQKRQANLKYATVFFTDYCTNDIATDGVTGPQAYVRSQTAYASARSALTGGNNKFVAQALLIPRTTSTDSWASGANQTPVAGFVVGGDRDTFNAAVISGAVGSPGPDDYVDFRSVSQHSLFPDRFETDEAGGETTANWWTIDGVHPQGGAGATRGHPQMAPIFAAKVALWTPASTGYSNEAQSLFAAMTTQPSTARKNLIDQLIVALKTAGVWSLIDVFYNLAAADSQSAALNWKFPGTLSLAPVNSPTFTVDRGYTGNGTNAVLTTGYNPGSATLGMSVNSAHMSIFALTDSTNTSADMFSDNARDKVIARAATAAAISVSVNTNTLATTGGSPPHLITGNRTTSATQALLRNGVLDTSASVAVVGSPSSFSLLGSTALSQFSNRQIALACIGQGLTTPQELAKYNAILAYMQGVGAA